MEDFLKHFGVSNQPFPGGDQTFQYDLSLGFVRMDCANQIHRNVGIDEDQLS
jgi:hypothetical protein